MSAAMLEMLFLFLIRGGVTAALFSHILVSFNFFFPYIAPRAAYFQFVTSITFVISILYISLFPQRRPKIFPHALPLLIYFSIILISTLTSVDISKSWVGTVERTFGAYHILHFGLLFGSAVIGFQTVRSWKFLFTVSTLLSLYPALEFLIPAVTKSASRGDSILGNPTFLGAYLLFNLSFTIFLFLRMKRGILQLPLAIIAIIQFATIIGSGVRGAFLGLSASALFLLGYTAYTQVRWRRPLIAMMLTLMAAYALVFINRTEDPFRKNYVVQKITNFSLTDATIKARFAMWRMAASGFLERPVLGWGRENYSIVFNRHFNASFNDAGVGEGWEDRTHNIFLDELVQSGLLGLLSYMAVIGMGLYLARKSPLFFAFLIGYIVQNMVGVESLNSAIPWYLLLAFLFFQENRAGRNLSLAENEESAKQPLQRDALRAYVPTGLCLLILGASTFFFTYRPIVANGTYLKALRILLTNGNYEGFLSLGSDASKKLSAAPSMEPELMVLSGISLYNVAVENFTQVRSFPRAAERITSELERLVQRNPLEERWTFSLAHIFISRAIVESDLTHIQRAEQIIHSLLAKTPDRELYQQSLTKSSITRQIIEQNKNAQGA